MSLVNRQSVTPGSEEKPDKLSVLQTKVDGTLFSLKIEKEDLSLSIKGT